MNTGARDGTWRPLSFLDVGITAAVRRIRDSNARALIVGPEVCDPARVKSSGGQARARARLGLGVAVWALIGGACTDTNNNADPSSVIAVHTDGGAGDAPVADAPVEVVGSRHEVGYLWFAGAALGAFSKAETQADTDSGPGYLLVPAAPVTSFHDLTFDTDGNLWTVPTSGNQILRLAAGGLGKGSVPPAPDLTISSSSLEAPLSLTFDGRGNLWVLCYNGAATSVATIVRLDDPRGQSGSVTMTPSVTIDPGSTTVGRSRFTQGMSIAFDRAGNLWMATVGNVLRFDQATTLSGTVTAAPSAIITTPGDAYASLAFDATGALWITGARAGYFAIRIANPSSLSGAVSPAPAARLRLAAEGATFAGGMGFDSDGALWVSMSNRLLKIGNAGSMAGEVTPAAAVVLGLVYQPDLASKIAFWPRSGT